MEHVQASVSLFRGSRKARAGDLRAEVRNGTTRGHRQRLRACQEEHDVCSSFPWRRLVQSRKLDCAGVKGGSILLGAKSMMIELVKVLRGVFLVRAAVQATVSWRDVEQDGFDICIVRCYGCENVWTLVTLAQRNGSESPTRQTLTLKR